MRLPARLDERYQLAAQIPAAGRPVVFVGPYEHHSNELPWRESIADVVVIGEDADGHIDLADLGPLPPACLGPWPASHGPDAGDHAPRGQASQ